MTENALPYQEPDITTILIQLSFILLLNVIGFTLDKLIYCGLVGQIFIGVAWGTAGSGWLSLAFQEGAVQLGYLGLIFIVYEGGLSTSTHALRSNLALSVAVAVTGIGLPMAFSYSLLKLSECTPLQAFAAGSALCSTSLGTTFTVLKTSGLITSRLGIVLTSAAMLDDVVGLVIVQVISDLGSSGSSIDAITIVRPIAVSIAFAAIVPLACIFVVKPTVLSLHQVGRGGPLQMVIQILQLKSSAFFLQMLLLLSFLAGASYAGTSNLFAAYLAGTVISWYDGMGADWMKSNSSGGADPEGCKKEPETKTDATAAAPLSTSSHQDNDNIEVHGVNLDVGHRIRNGDGKACETAAGSSVDDLARPSALGPEAYHMSDRVREQDLKNEAISKEGTGNVLKEASNASEHGPCQTVPTTEAAGSSESSWIGRDFYENICSKPVNLILGPFFFASIGFSIPISQMFNPSIIWRGMVYAILMALGKLFCGLWLVRLTSQQPISTGADHKGSKWKFISLPKPKSLYPAALLGSAMIARGEIGFLVSAIAESNGVFRSPNAEHSAGISDVFLIVTWAILLCTIVGPVAVGLLTRRVRTLEAKERGNRTGREDPLGIWGIL